MNDLVVQSSGQAPEAVHHQDRSIMQWALLSQLVELSALVISHQDDTWLNEQDVLNIATACGCYDEYTQVIKLKPKQEKISCASVK